MTKLRSHAPFGQRRVHNAFGGTHAALALFSDASLRVMAVAGLALTVTAATLLTGCAHAVPAAYTPPSVAPVASAVAGTRCEIANTREAIAKAAKRAEALNIPAADRQALQAAFSEADEYAQRAEQSAVLAQTNLVTFNTAVTNQTATLNKTTDRLNYIEPKYEKAVGLIWKWRLIALGIIGAIAALLVIKYGSRIAVTAASIAAKVP